MRKLSSASKDVLFDQAVCALQVSKVILRTASRSISNIFVQIRRKELSPPTRNRNSAYVKTSTLDVRTAVSSECVYMSVVLLSGTKPAMQAQTSDQVCGPEQHMQVLCLGLPRGGTDSLCRALSILGIRAYHGNVLALSRPQGLSASKKQTSIEPISMG